MKDDFTMVHDHQVTILVEVASRNNPYECLRGFKWLGEDKSIKESHGSNRSFECNQNVGQTL